MKRAVFCVVVVLFTTAALSPGLAWRACCVVGVESYHLGKIAWVWLEGYQSNMAVNMPEEGRPGHIVKGWITVENTGSRSWTRGENYFALGLTGRKMAGWGSREASAVTFDNGTDRVIMPIEGVRAGSAVSFPLTVRLPEKPAEYTFWVQMVQEGRNWFGVSRRVRIRAINWAPEANASGAGVLYRACCPPYRDRRKDEKLATF